MSPNFIRVRFTDEGDSTGMLTAEGRSGYFAGQGTACFLISELHSFAERIAAYPLPKTPVLEIRGGYLSTSNPATLDQEHLALHVYPTNSRGSVAIQLRAATPFESGDRHEAQSRAVLHLHVTYEALCHFSQSFKALLRGDTGEALIEGSGDAG